MAHNLENPVNVTGLNDTPISHLLWADDIVLLARDKKVSKDELKSWNHTVRSGVLKSVSATTLRAKQQSLYSTNPAANSKRAINLNMEQQLYHQQDHIHT